MPRYDISRFFTFFQRKWNLFSFFASFVLTMVGAFILEPPHVETEQWKSLGQFLIAVVAGVMVLPISLWHDKRHTFRWYLVSLCSTFLAVCSLLVYSALLAMWTVKYDNQGRRIIGPTEHLAPEIVQQLKQNHTPMDDLVMSVDGRTTQLWPLEELVLRDYELAAIYIFCLCCFALAIISLGQTLYCINRII